MRLNVMTLRNSTPTIFIILGGNERKLSCKDLFKCNFLIYLIVDSSPMNRFLCLVNGGV